MTEQPPKLRCDSRRVRHFRPMTLSSESNIMTSSHVALVTVLGSILTYQTHSFASHPLPERHGRSPRPSLTSSSQGGATWQRSWRHPTESSLACPRHGSNVLFSHRPPEDPRGSDFVDSANGRVRRRTFLSRMATLTVFPSSTQAADAPSPSRTPFHSAAYGREEYTNSSVASRDTNISPREVYDTIASEYLKEALDAAWKVSTGNEGVDGGKIKGPRALDVGAGKIVCDVLLRLGLLLSFPS